MHSCVFSFSSLVLISLNSLPSIASPIIIGAGIPSIENAFDNAANVVGSGFAQIGQAASQGDFAGAFDDAGNALEKSMQAAAAVGGARNDLIDSAFARRQVDPLGGVDSAFQNGAATAANTLAQLGQSLSQGDFEGAGDAAEQAFAQTGKAAYDTDEAGLDALDSAFNRRDFSEAPGIGATAAFGGYAPGIGAEAYGPGSVASGIGSKAFDGKTHSGIGNLDLDAALGHVFSGSDSPFDRRDELTGAVGIDSTAGDGGFAPGIGAEAYGEGSVASGIGSKAYDGEVHSGIGNLDLDEVLGHVFESSPFERRVYPTGAVGIGSTAAFGGYAPGIGAEAYGPGSVASGIGSKAFDGETHSGIGNLDLDAAFSHVFGHDE